MPEKLKTQGLHEDMERHFWNEGGCDEGTGMKKEGMMEEISNQKRPIMSAQFTQEHQQPL